MSDKPDIKPVITPQGGIKLERLPSFQKTRDLTLGGPNAARRGSSASARAKPIFTPNLNVQRRKPKEETKVKEEPTRKEKNARGQGPRGRGDRGRGRNVIQSTGVFAEGMGSNEYKSSRSRYSGGGGGGGGGDDGEAMIMKPTVDFKAALKADAKEEEARLRLLLRDDFIDDPDAQGPKVLPIQLPVSAKLRGKSIVKKEEPKDEDNKNGITVSAVRIKQEPVEENAPLEDSKEGFLDFLCKNEPEFILLQLPDCLPGLRPSSEPDNPKQAQSSSAGTSTDKSQQQQCTLSTLSDSQLGKIELLRSGAARLRIGELTFPLSTGTQAGFRQDVVAVELDESSKSGDMLNLGSVQTRMIATPDWDSLLLKSSAGKFESPVDSLVYQMARS